MSKTTSVGPTGPIPPEQFYALLTAPCGTAAQVIRKFDPLWGRSGEDSKPRKWEVKVTRQVTMVGYLTVEAGSEEDAETIAANVPDRDVDWEEDFSERSEIESVEPQA